MSKEGFVKHARHQPKQERGRWDWTLETKNLLAPCCPQIILSGDAHGMGAVGQHCVTSVGYNALTLPLYKSSGYFASCILSIRWRWEDVFQFPNTFPFFFFVFCFYDWFRYLFSTVTILLLAKLINSTGTLLLHSVIPSTIEGNHRYSDSLLMLRISLNNPVFSSDVKFFLAYSLYQLIAWCLGTGLLCF